MPDTRATLQGLNMTGFGHPLAARAADMQKACRAVLSRARLVAARMFMKSVLARGRAVAARKSLCARGLSHIVNRFHKLCGCGPEDREWFHNLLPVKAREFVNSFHEHPGEWRCAAMKRQHSIRPHREEPRRSWLARAA